MAKLSEYHKKRDFKRTPEPRGKTPGEAANGGGRYVIHKHAARRLHYDLRLERGGVFESWAVPKGLSMKPGVKRLAVKVEDHPLDYGDFEGVIPKGEYGGGTVMVWDKGQWQKKLKKNGRLDFELRGVKLHGNWTLTRMKGSGKGNEWLVIKRSEPARQQDEPFTPPVAEDRSVTTGRTMDEIAADLPPVTAEPGMNGLSPSALEGARPAPLPVEPRPQLATLSQQVPRGDQWIHEIKFDGYRLLARIDHGEVRLITRNGKDWTGRFERIADALRTLPIQNAILDGEVVAIQRDGTSSFRLLQKALATEHTGNLVYQLFDLLYLDGVDLRNAPLLERKRLLGQLTTRAALTKTGTLRYTEHLPGAAEEFHAEACRLGLEGIICKHADEPYRAGRNRHWLKVKCNRHDEFIIGGYTSPAGSRVGFGALLLGAYEDSRLVYTGRVGTGFTNQQLRTLHARLSELETDESPFDTTPKVAGAHWVRPQLVGEVEYTEQTRDGKLRHPTFRGLREDRNPEEITLKPTESAAAAPGKKQRPPRTAEVSPAGDAIVAGVRLTSAERVLYPAQNITKLALARYYEAVAEWMLPRVAHRPLSLVRCPEGRDGECFFQKHPRTSLARGVPRIDIAEKAGKKEPYLYVSRPRDLVSLVQSGTLEIHCWGSRIEDLEHPDMLVFDLDPGAGVSWSAVMRTGVSLKERLEGLGLTAFLRTTGGKGLHIVVPLRPEASWDDAKNFCRGIALAAAKDAPRELTANMAKAKRKGRIFIDYLRNGRGATAIASYSTRAREGAPVAVPVRWDELSASLTSDRYRVDNVRRRLAALKSDPWEEFEEARRPLSRRLLKSAGPVS